MSNNYQALLENGQIKWLETPPNVTSARVVITVLPPEKDAISSKKLKSGRKRQLGFMQGKMTVPDDIHWGDEEVREMFGDSI